eukprot:4155790-Pleurochrysis_carterae.AAC.1
MSRPVASSQPSGGPSSRSWPPTPASATSARQSAAAACNASLEPTAPDGVSSSRRPAAFASARAVLPSPPRRASSSCTTRAGVEDSSPAGRRPSSASAP